MADLRFGVGVGISGGNTIPGHVKMTNVSGRPCAMTGYLALQWRDASGNVMPINVVNLPGTEPAHSILVPPGATAVAGLYWTRHKSPPPAAPVSCPPFPATIDAQLPEQGPPARVPWVAGDDGSLCGGAVELRPVDIIR